MKRHKQSPDAAEIERAVAHLLEASGLDLGDSDLQGTPARVARLWQDAFLSGYTSEPAQILGDVVVGEAETELVVVRDLPCHGMCPHHLMPWTGKATIAYLPGAKLVGFGRLDQLLHCYARRFTLQERVCNDVADALMNFLDARGAACIVHASHNCLNVPADKHATRVTTSAYRGAFKHRSDLQALLLAESS